MAATMQVNFRKFPSGEASLKVNATKPYKLFVNNGITIENVISIYNLTFGENITNLYNSYGQSLPNSYQIYKADFDLFVV